MSCKSMAVAEPAVGARTCGPATEEPSSADAMALLRCSRTTAQQNAQSFTEQEFELNPLRVAATCLCDL